MGMSGGFPKICLFHNSQSMFKIIPMFKIRENKDVIETTTLGVEGDFIEQLWILSLEQCPKRMKIAETSAFDSMFFCMKTGGFSAGGFEHVEC
jgi:hypothetical protein